MRVPIACAYAVNCHNDHFINLSTKLRVCNDRFSTDEDHAMKKADLTVKDQQMDYEQLEADYEDLFPTLVKIKEEFYKGKEQPSLGKLPKPRKTKNPMHYQVSVVKHPKLRWTGRVSRNSRKIRSLAISRLVSKCCSGEGCDERDFVSFCI